MELVQPNERWEASFADALHEFDVEGITGFWNFRVPIDSIVEYIGRTQAYVRGEQLPYDMVPASTFWLIDDDQFVGHVNIRHRLTPRLSLIGGHIGYAVRPSAHGKGYGSKLLELALPQAKALGISRALLTCDPPNIASRKIIEKNGGKLLDEILVGSRPILRFMVTTAS